MEQTSAALGRHWDRSDLLMFHLTDRLLEKLTEGSATPTDVQRIRRHVEECRACARRLEEWRDNFSEVDERFPELSFDSGPSATVTSDGLIMLPAGEQRPRFELDLRTALWIGVGLMAILVGYGAFRPREPAPDFGAYMLPAPDSTEPPPAVAPQPVETIPSPDTISQRAGTTTPPRPAATLTARPAQPPAPAPARTTSRPDTVASSLPVSPNFRSIRLNEAERRLGGRVRLLRGLQADHVEVGPAFAVPGAHPDIDVVRVVYQSPAGPIFLDQQLIPEDSTGLRPIDDPVLESGETAYGTAPSGASIATWFDEDGYRISLAAMVAIDSLKKLVQRVR